MYSIFTLYINIYIIYIYIYIYIYRERERERELLYGVLTIIPNARILRTHSTVKITVNTVLRYFSTLS